METWPLAMPMRTSEQGEWLVRTRERGWQEGFNARNKKGTAHGTFFTSTT
jgi:hypothetical protein